MSCMCETAGLTEAVGGREKGRTECVSVARCSALVLAANLYFSIPTEKKNPLQCFETNLMRSSGNWPGNSKSLYLIFFFCRQSEELRLHLSHLHLPVEALELPHSRCGDRRSRVDDAANDNHWRFYICLQFAHL